MLLASADIVAVDAAAVRSAESPPQEVEHIALAAGLKVGRMDLDALNHPEDRSVKRFLPGLRLGGAWVVGGCLPLCSSARRTGWVSWVLSCRGCRLGRR